MCGCFAYTVTRVSVLFTVWPVWLFCLQCDMRGYFAYTVTRVTVLYSVTCAIVLFTVWPV